MEESFFMEDIKAVDKAVEFVKKWNEKRFFRQPIRLNVPQVWEFKGPLQGTSIRKGTKTLVEPFIENYRKFNSNSGWQDSSTPWPQVMQSLSHFSYHTSNGQYLLCDIQGGVYSNSVVLTDPVILSKTGEFGVTDLGRKGMSTFFSQHRCNQYCKSHWLKPTNCKQYFHPQEGTSMMTTGEATMAPPPPRPYHERSSSLATGRATMAPPPPRAYNR